MWIKFVQITLLFYLIPLNQLFSQGEPYFLCIKRINQGSTELFWSEPTHNGTIDVYEIWAGTAIDGSNLRLISTVPNDKYNFVITNQNLFTFQIRAKNLSNGNTSIISSNILSHQEEEVRLITSNVNGNFLELEWEPYHDGAGMITYNIYQKTENGDQLVQTVMNQTKTSLNLESLVDSDVFSIVAIDNCGNSSPPYYFNYLFLAASKVDKCTQSISLFWNAYLLSNSSEYHIQEFVNGTWNSFAQTVQQNINVIYQGRTEMKLRLLLITGDGQKIYSNELEFENLPAYSPQNYLEIENISFNNSNDPIIQWSSDKNPYVNSLIATSDSQQWTIDPTSGEAEDFTIDGEEILPVSESDLGRELHMVSNDECENRFESEETAWPFLYEENQFGNYFFRTVNNISQKHKIIGYDWIVNNQVFSSTNTESITISNTQLKEDENYVLVDIKTEFTDHDGNTQNQVFRSNTVQLSASPSIPNAISLSQTDSFPIRFITNSEILELYNLEIFNRAGNRIYSSNNPKEGWTPIGIEVPTTLLYRLLTKTKDKETKVSIGTILLVD